MKLCHSPVLAGFSIGEAICGNPNVNASIINVPMSIGKLPGKSYAMLAIALAACSAARADNASFTNVQPECRVPAGSAIPAKYAALAKPDKNFSWLAKVTNTDKSASGKGDERVDGSAMYEWFDFYRADLNDDGMCDWFIDAHIPLSTGGDRDSINTIYLGQRKGWLRIGAPAPDNRQDSLGVGKMDEQQSRYLFGEDLALLYDSGAHVHYLIASFPDRHAQRDTRPGYRMFVWDDKDHTLRLLDKWEPGSKAAAAYAYFKAHGARVPVTKPAAPADAILQFDPDVEAFEMKQACNPDSAERMHDELGKLVSPHLLARCKRR